MSLCVSANQRSRNMCPCGQPRALLLGGFHRASEMWARLLWQLPDPHGRNDMGLCRGRTGGTVLWVATKVGRCW
eukprot:10022676-Prorocentrum_lima.AAC.1